MSMTLQQIADELGITKQMVLKIEKRALAKAKALMEASDLTLEEVLRGENVRPSQTDKV